MVCVRLNFNFRFPSWLKLKHNNDGNNEAEDYAYFKWEFKASEQELDGNETVTDIPKHAKTVEETGFENIHTWLKRHNTGDNCTNEDDLHYACVDVTEFPLTSTPRLSRSNQSLEFSREYKFINHQEASYNFGNIKTGCDGFANDEEASYSYQIRRKANTLFIKQ